MKMDWPLNWLAWLARLSSSECWTEVLRSFSCGLLYVAGDFIKTSKEEGKGEDPRKTEVRLLGISIIVIFYSIEASYWV